MSEKKSKEILSTILNRGIVKKYYALKMTRYTMKYFKEKKFTDCWILFQECSNCESIGTTEVDILGEKFSISNNMDMQNVYCILYRVGAYYCHKKVSYDASVQKMKIESLLIEAGALEVMTQDEKEERGSVSGVAREPQYEVLYANDNGFFEEGRCYGDENVPKESRVCYRPAAKKINERVVDRIIYSICSNDKENDWEGYRNYFLTTLSDKYMVLSEDDCMMLYAFLSGNACCFNIDAEEYYLRKDYDKTDFELFKIQEDGSIEFYEDEFPTNQDLFLRWSTKQGLIHYLNKRKTMGMKDSGFSDKEMEDREERRLAKLEEVRKRFEI